MLWRIYKNDPQICSYLFGTMHLPCVEAYKFSDLAKKYIVKSSIYAAEMDLNQSIGQNMMSHFLLQDGKKFSDFFRPAVYKKYHNLVQKVFGLSLSNYQDYTPFFIHNILVEASIVKQHMDPLDHHLWKYAMDHGCHMTGLESFEDQVSIMSQIPLDFQVKTFRESMKNIKLFKQKLAKIVALYADGNVQQLYKYSKRSMGRIRKLMIYDRNQLMAERIKALADQKATFFAIGAAHYPGDKGILAILQRNGFKIQHIKN